MAEVRTPNAFLVFLGAAAAIGVVIIIVGGLVARRPARADDVELRRAKQRMEAREKLDKAADEQLTTADWVDKAKGVVRLPVEDAIKLVATELAGKKPAPSQVKVDPPLPMPPPYDPNSKEPPIAPLTSSPQGADTIRFDPPAAPPAPPPAASPAAAIAPALEKATASAAPNRPPLIHWTEPFPTKK